MEKVGVGSLLNICGLKMWFHFQHHKKETYEWFGETVVAPRVTELLCLQLAVSKVCHTVILQSSLSNAVIS